MAKQQVKKSTRSPKVVKYEKGHKVQRFLWLAKNPTRGKRNRETLLNISMSCVL